MIKTEPERITAYLCPDNSLLFTSYSTSYPSAVKPILCGRRPANVRKSIESLLMTALANQFNFWATLSFGNENAIDEYRQWRSEHYPEMSYVEVAIQSVGRTDKPHPNDERWHIHMLASGIPESDLAPKMVIMPSGVSYKMSRATQQYRWLAVEDYFKGKPNMTDVQRLGALNWYGEPILQAGKAIYMARQYETAKPAVFARGRRLYNCSHGLIDSLPVIGRGEISTWAREEFFDHRGSFPFGLSGSFGSYVSTAGSRIDWRDTLADITTKHPGTTFDSPTLVPAGAPF
ncbi:hypothetical protein CE91St41_26750 [Oscillospiraceae bacterium]|nr:hypothetical protein CE91St40_10790 [Oscillospiraceae bacterium]BDF75786.1 hypothetical protein CE91St41_26750 [Oscillospiraceae bacterium]